jgi:hypothetical protein
MAILVTFLSIEAHTSISKNFPRPVRAGVGNSFGFAGHIRDKLDIRGPVHVHVN